MPRVLYEISMWPNSIPDQQKISSKYVVADCLSGLISQGNVSLKYIKFSIYQFKKIVVARSYVLKPSKIFV